MFIPRKAVTNFFVEGMTLLTLMGLVATGFSISFRLPPGSRGGGQTITQLGLSRHDWGDIHFYLALFFIGLLVLHLFLHWRWIWGMVRGNRTARRGRRIAAFAAATVMVLMLAAVPWMIPVDQAPGGGRGGQGAGGGFRGGGAAAAPVQLRGSMTFGELSRASGIGLETLARQMGLKATPAPEDRLGRTLRDAGTSVAEARTRLFGNDESWLD